MSKKGKRKESWGPTAAPNLRRNYHRSLVDLIGRQERAREDVQRRIRVGEISSVTDLIPEWTQEQWDAQINGFRNEARKIDLAPMFWVTRDMIDTALDASEDIPSVCWDEILPHNTGFMAFGAPLPPIEGLADLEVDAVSWYTTEDGKGLMITPLSKSSRYGAGQHALSGPFQPWPAVIAPNRHVSLPLADAQVEEYEVGSGKVDKHDMNDDQLRFMAFMATTMHLMMMPTVAHRRLLDGRTGEPAREAAPNVRTDVTLIDLRPIRQIFAEKEKGDGGRVYQHRWFVRGHWRNQRVGQDRAQTRVTWIPSYIKGPEGAPLLATEKVMVWRR